jgi:phosphatidylserine decarboxylase
MDVSAKMFASKSEPLLLAISALTAISMLFVPLSLWVLLPLGLLIITTIFLMFFFRDPKRVSPDEKGIMVSPAEGKVVGVTNLEDGSLKIQLELSVFNVHVNRVPIKAKLLKLTREKGGHWPVWYKGKYDKNNARLHFDFQSEEGFDFRVTQIAGIFAWRCVSYIDEGDILNQNDKMGIIRFGSAANIILPKDCIYKPEVTAGQKVRAGETIIARRSD